MEDRLLYTLALGFTRGVGPMTAKALIEHFGHAGNVYRSLESGLEGLKGFGAKLMQEIKIRRNKAMAMAQKELDQAKTHGVSILGHWHPEFPKRLWRCPDSPLCVYRKGKAVYNHARTACILGSDTTSIRYHPLLRYVLKGLKKYGVMLICGNDSTWDRVLQKTSSDLQIPSTIVLSESIYAGLDPVSKDSGRSFLSGYPGSAAVSSKKQMLKNRMLAGLSDVCIVVEASKSDSALAVAEKANEYHRDVAAFPGSIWKQQSYGTHLLIKTHKAALISRMEDLGYITGWTYG